MNADLNVLLYQAHTGVKITLDRAKRHLVAGRDEQALELLQMLGHCQLLDLLKIYDGGLPMNAALYEWQYHDLMREIRTLTPRELDAKRQPVSGEFAEVAEKAAHALTQLLAALSSARTATAPQHSQTG